MKRTFIGLASLTLATSLTVACGDDGPSTTVSDETMGDGDPGDGDPGDGDPGDGDPGDGDGDPGDGDGDPDPGPDTDMDGTPDAVDNCPDIPNPNQLDFDGNGAGNVCDVQAFTNVTGTLMSTASAMAFVGGCNIPIEINVNSGSVLVQLDDDAAIAAFEIVELRVDDILDQQCDLGVAVTVSLTEFLIQNDGGPFPVSMAHDSGQHDNGQVLGDSDAPHPVLSTAILTTDAQGSVMDSPLDLPGELPIFTANISDAGAMGSLAWADGTFVLASMNFMVEVMGIPVDIEFELRGLIGSLSIAP